MPSFIKNLAGGKAVSGGSLAPRSRRGNANQVNAYWSGGGGYDGIIATGGTIIDYAGFRAHVFTSSGTFSVASLGGYGGAIEYLIVAGGGGAQDYGYGGAGGYRELTGTVTASTNYTITIGAGGVVEANNAGNVSNGGNSSAFGNSATGGGRHVRGTGSNGYAGGSGGGAGGANNGQVYGTGGAGNLGGYSPVEGYKGGDTGYDWSGGGGGAGGAGSSTGAAGIGRSNSYTGTATTYGRGGEYLLPAPANSGNGGSTFGGINGGSGIVVIRFQV